jgi:hypothetical protein
MQTPYAGGEPSPAVSLTPVSPPDSALHLVPFPPDGSNTSGWRLPAGHADLACRLSSSADEWAWWQLNCRSRGGGALRAMSRVIPLAEFIF